MIHTAGHNADTDLLLRAEEAANMWWRLVICEREVTVLDQLDILDPESLPNIPVSCLTSPKVGGFSRTAQATCLLDQVLKSFDTPDIDSRLLQLDRLDTSIQAFLSLVMPQCQGQSGIFCAVINIAIRALFTLH